MRPFAPTAPQLSPEELRRYGRQMVMPELGPEGQERLKETRVLVVGAGGLGSPSAIYLAAAGVGGLGLVDFDRVDESNLHRQILYGQSDLGRPKLDAAVERLREVNPHVEVTPIPGRFDAANARELVETHDIVVDGTDNFPARYLVNDACVLAGKPNVFGSILRFEGQVAVFWAARGPCYRCLFPEPPPPGLVPSCAEAGVLGALPGIIGSLQANEAIKLAAGIGEPLVGRLLILDALSMRFRELSLEKAATCPVCSDRPSLTELVEYEAACAPGEESAPDGGGEEQRDIEGRELRRRMEAGREVVLLDVRTPQEHAVAAIEGSLLIPLQQLPGRLEELDPAAETVVYCHRGPRAIQAVNFLRRSGFSRAHNLRGGIDAWSLEVDPSVPRY